MSRRRPNREARKAELPALESQTSTITGVTSISPCGFVCANAWIQSGNRYYFDLAHNRGRVIVLLQLYDSVLNSYLSNVSEYQPLPGSELYVLRIWLDWDPGANRIIIMYI